jgi:hypothetical protein
MPALMSSRTRAVPAYSDPLIDNPRRLTGTLPPLWVWDTSGDDGMLRGAERVGPEIAPEPRSTVVPRTGHRSGLLFGLLIPRLARSQRQDAWPSRSSSVS